MDRTDHITPNPTEQAPRPARMIGFAEAISRGFSRFAQFSGRASRAEYWWWILFGFLVTSALGLIEGMLGLATGDERTGPISGPVELLILIPTISLSIRRLHDIGRSGWWVLPLYLGVGLSLLLNLALMAAPNAVPDYPTGNLGGILILFALILIAYAVYSVMILIWHILPSQPYPNRYGPVPRPEKVLA
ncbi:MAG: DUF805 domain-containing protein [Paracoccus sp. (in: a-proteobacteria)]|nr:DUF805 domain-containing protein [Paracoccus sp. (in: a-proteobacteria)]